MTTASPCGPVDDPLVVAAAAARRPDLLAVDAFVDGDDIARLRRVGGALDRVERGRFRAGIGVVAADGHVELRCACDRG